MSKQKIYQEIKAKSALNKLKRKIPYGWDLNLYRGCIHNCVYCYALQTHEYITSAAFEDEIFVKTNIAEVLEKELAAPEWKQDVINIGGVTDSYQPAEEVYALMPQILKLLIKYKTPAIISTKSNLILRDYDLIDQLSRITYINIAATITTGDEDIRKKIEQDAAPTADRFHLLKEFRKTNASLGLHVMPIIPFLTDSEENFEYLFFKAQECSVDYVLAGTLYLRGKSRKRFLDFIKHEFPEYENGFSDIYTTGSAVKDYKNQLYEMVNHLRSKYNLSSSYMKPMREKLPK